MKWDKLILWLRKLGILRYGTYSYTFKGWGLPIQSVMDDVIDPEKDLMFHCEVGKRKKEKEEHSDGSSSQRDRQ